MGVGGAATASDQSQTPPRAQVEQPRAAGSSRGNMRTSGRTSRVSRVSFSGDDGALDTTKFFGDSGANPAAPQPQRVAAPPKPRDGAGAGAGVGGGARAGACGGGGATAMPACCQMGAGGSFAGKFKTGVATKMQYQHDYHGTGTGAHSYDMRCGACFCRRGDA